MKHLLDINDLNRIQIEHIIDRAFSFKSSIKLPLYSSETLATLFYENSTRTRVSFELAAKKLSMATITIDLQHSSESKGEIIEDTFRTLAAMGISAFVIRHQQEKLPHQLASLNKAKIINAGDGKNSHPSQSLLDVMTIIEKKKDLSKLKVAIVGDVLHSRVANSLQAIFSILDVGQLNFIAPTLWAPTNVQFGKVYTSLKEGIVDADVIICLRVQKERLLENESLDLNEYKRNYCLSKEMIAYAKPDVMIMHPGPINRELEITSEIADGPYSVILQQVANGVFARMAIIDYLLT